MSGHRADRLQTVVNKAVGSPGRAASCLPTLLAILAVVVAVVVVCLKILFSRRKVEKMMSEMRMADEEKIQALEAEELAECEEERAAIQKKVEEVEARVEELKEGVQERRRGHAKLVQELRSVVNWDDLEVIDAREES